MYFKVYALLLNLKLFMNLNNISLIIDDFTNA